MSKRVRRFDPSSTGLDHVLVSRVLKCLRFRRDDLIADGRQMVSLISVHGRGSLSDVYGLLHFSLVPVGFTGQYFSVLRGH